MRPREGERPILIGLIPYVVPFLIAGSKVREELSHLLWGQHPMGNGGRFLLDIGFR
jgi:hypothetical protein